MQMQIVHSCPAWIVGPRRAHPKFGGVEIGGIAKVSDRLRAIHGTFPDDLTSGHLLHEIKSTNGMFVDLGLNSPNAIEWDHLVEGIEEGKFPRIAALTAPSFGLPDSHLGSILSADPAVVGRTYHLHSEAITRSLWLKERGLGLGKVIWWAAFDAITRWLGVPRAEAWERFKGFWVDLLRVTGGEMHIEWKPSVPGDADYLSTLVLAMKFAQEVSEELGRKAVWVNNEWAHLLIGGMPVAVGTKLTCEGGLFDGFFHANSAELAVVEYDLDGSILRGTPGDDKDWAVGLGGDERWADQERAVRILLASGTGLIVEHDICPSGLDPIEYYALSRGNLEKMAAVGGKVA